MLLTEYSVTQCLSKFRDIRDFTAVFQSKTPSLARMVKEIGFDVVSAWIEMWLINMRESINIGKKMTDSQCQETAMLILEEYPLIKIADIHLIFRMAKTNQFGIIYDRLDCTVVLNWFKTYFEQRLIAAENQSIREHDNIKYGQQRDYQEEKRGEQQNDADYKNFRVGYMASKLFDKDSKDRRK
jgi:hypothetical protein